MRHCARRRRLQAIFSQAWFGLGVASFGRFDGAEMGLLARPRHRKEVPAVWSIFAKNPVAKKNSIRKIGSSSAS
jgi:hypothetical protein